MSIATGSVVLIGKESVGKSQLLASLTGRPAQVANFRGTTVACETYDDRGRAFVDTPGLLRRADSEAARETLARLAETDHVLLVAKATHLDDDLADLLPLVVGKRGAVALTYWDKVRDCDGASASVARISRELEMDIIPIDARRLSLVDRVHLRASLDRASTFPESPPRERASWRIEPRPSPFDRPWVGPPLALLLLLVPAAAAVWGANAVAAAIEPVVQRGMAGMVGRFAAWPSPLKDVLAGRYGFATMLPLMFVWAMPTVVLFAILLACFKASGLIDQITLALDPLTRPWGLAARDVVRVLMGFGCNVPAVLNTRACSSCSRGTCISAIAFGSACSYQLGATLGVFAAARSGWLIVPYLGYLGLTTAIYTAFVSRPPPRAGKDLLVIQGRDSLQRPRFSTVRREASTNLRHFFLGAMPIFLAITITASLLDWLGVISGLSSALAPTMRLFGLPPTTASAIVLASIRKDGILLLAEPATVASLTPWQLLTAVYLAGVLLPCLVTAFTIAREQSWPFALRLLTRQALAAVLFTRLLASMGQGWGSH